MDFNDSQQEAAFRKEARDFLEANAEKRSIISDKPIEEIFEDLLNKNDSYNIKESFSLSDLIAKKLSKLLSVKTGKTLKLKEQQAIINQLFSCKEPKLSPFNKQIFVTLDKKYLDKKFFNG